MYEFLAFFMNFNKQKTLFCSIHTHQFFCSSGTTTIVLGICKNNRITNKITELTCPRSNVNELIVLCFLVCVVCPLCRIELVAIKKWECQLWCNVACGNQFPCLSFQQVWALVFWHELHHIWHFLCVFVDEIIEREIVWFN